MIAHWWAVLPDKFPSVTTDAFVVMPNHVHGIIVINAAHNAGEHTAHNAGEYPEHNAGEHTGSPLHIGHDAVRADQRVRPQRIP
jgi:hypothetical protein